ncbi:putative Rab GTPase-activating protein 1-like [Trypoxylus dichotomus]
MHGPQSELRCSDSLGAPSRIGGGAGQAKLAVAPVALLGLKAQSLRQQKEGNSTLHPANLWKAQIVVNLSNRELTTEEISVLFKGGNFAITPKNLPAEDTIANIESSIRGPAVVAAEEICRETSRILQHAKPSKSNFTNKESSAIKSLNADENKWV